MGGGGEGEKSEEVVAGLAQLTPRDFVCSELLQAGSTQYGEQERIYTIYIVDRRKQTRCVFWGGVYKAR